MPEVGFRRRPWIWAAVAPAALWALVRLFGLETGFPMVPLMAFTPYAAAASVVLVAAVIPTRNRAALALAVLAAVILVGAQVPRLAGSGEPIPPGHRELRVMGANVLHGRADAGDLVSLVASREVEVLSVEELTPSFDRELRRAGLYDLLPEAVVHTRRGASGGGLYASLPLRPIEGAGGATFRMPRAVVELGDGLRARVASVHPFPPNAGDVGLWEGEMRSLPRGDEAGPPWILPGDFNASLDFDRFRALVDSGYRDAAEVTGAGLEPTWPQDSLLGPLIAIDHVLVAKPVLVGEFAVESLPGSDHKAVFAALGVPPLSR